MILHNMRSNSARNMRAAGSDPLPGAGGGGLEQPAFVKTKCVTRNVGFHAAIWNQRLQSVWRYRYADFGDEICC